MLCTQRDQKKRENAVRQRHSSPQPLQWKQRRRDLSWLFSTRSRETAADVKKETDSRNGTFLVSCLRGEEQAACKSKSQLHFRFSRLLQICWIFLWELSAINDKSCCSGNPFILTKCRRNDQWEATSNYLSIYSIFIIVTMHNSNSVESKSVKLHYLFYFKSKCI